MTSRIDKAIEENGLRQKSDAELAFIFKDAGAAWEAVRGHDKDAAVKYADLCFAVSRVERERHPVERSMTDTEALVADGKL